MQFSIVLFILSVLSAELFSRWCVDLIVFSCKNPNRQSMHLRKRGISTLASCATLKCFVRSTRTTDFLSYSRLSTFCMQLRWAAAAIWTLFNQNWNLLWLLYSILYIVIPSIMLMWCGWWCSVRVSDLQSRGCGFNSWSRHRLMTLGKLFAPLCLCH